MISKVPYAGTGYLDAGRLMPHVPPFVWIWGGRGIGKTFGFLKYVRLDCPRKFLIMRRTQKQIDLLRKPMFNPFKPIDEMFDCITVCRKDGDSGVFYNGVDDGEKIIPNGPPIGYAVALSAIHNVRGIDLSDVDIVIYDEYCPEIHERPIRGEYLAYLNAMETIGRNRELQGKAPLQFVGLSNSNTLGNPYFIGLGVIRTVDKMLKAGREIWCDEKRGLMLINITASPISDAKSKTSLYKLAGSGEFSEMSLGNRFAQDECTNQGSIPLIELKPLVHVGELCIYTHKSKRNVYYCTDKVSGSPETYFADDTSLRRFRRDWSVLWNAFLDNSIVFVDVLAEILFKIYIGIS